MRAGTAQPRAPVQPAAGTCGGEVARLPPFAVSGRTSRRQRRVAFRGSQRPCALHPAPPGRARLSAAAAALRHRVASGRGQPGRQGRGRAAVLFRALRFHFVKELFLCNVGFICHPHFRDENRRPVSDPGRPAGCLASAHYACPLCRREQVARDSEVHEFTC